MPVWMCGAVHFMPPILWWNDWFKLDLNVWILAPLDGSHLVQKKLRHVLRAEVIKKCCAFPPCLCSNFHTSAKPCVMSFKACSQDGNRCRRGFLVRFAKDCTTLPFKPTEIQGRLWFGSTSPCKPLLYCWWDTWTIKKYIVHLSVWSRLPV